MFFSLSKLLWFATSPASVLVVLLAVGVVMLWSRWRRAGRRLVTLVAALFLAAAVLPVGSWLLLPLENRFPTVHTLPERVDGIVVLGGVVDPRVSRARGQVALGSAVERLTEFAALARRYPKAKLVFTGGSGDIFNQDMKEGDVLAPVFQDLGLNPERVLVENQARNTYENAVRARALADPRPGERWVLITSAFHMPRAVGSFRQAGWSVIPYPVDYALAGNQDPGLSFDVLGGLGQLTIGVHEWLGLFFYWLTGRSDAFFPAPAG